jgi:hypothetical protein
MFHSSRGSRSKLEESCALSWVKSLRNGLTSGNLPLSRLNEEFGLRKGNHPPWSAAGGYDQVEEVRQLGAVTTEALWTRE